MQTQRTLRLSGLLFGLLALTRCATSSEEEKLTTSDSTPHKSSPFDSSSSSCPHGSDASPLGANTSAPLIHVLAAQDSNPEEEAAAPQWEKCTNARLKTFSRCANITVPLSRRMNTGKNIELVAVKIEALTPKSIVWVMGDFCLSVKNTEWILTMIISGHSIGILFPRGSALSSRPLSCGAGDAGQDGLPSDECIKEFNQNQTAQYFTLDEMVSDLRQAIQLLGAKQENYFLGDGMLGPLFAHRMQIMYPATLNNTVLRYINLGFVNASSYSLLNYQQLFYSTDSVVQRILHACEQVPQCVGQAANGVDLWGLLRGLLDAARFNRLICTTKLKRSLAPHGWRNTIMRVIREMVTKSELYSRGILSHQFASFLPPFLYRLQRCNKNDVAVLNLLITKLLNPPSPSAQLCPTTNLLRNHILINEITRTTDQLRFTLIDQLVQWVAISPDKTYASRLHDVIQKWPRYPPSSAAQKPVPKGTYVFNLLSTLDPRFPLEEESLGAVYNKLPTIYFATLSPGSASPLLENNPCILPAMAAFFTKDEKLNITPSYCLTHPSFLDFMGTNIKLKDLRHEYWGSDDMWEFDSVPSSFQYVLPHRVYEPEESDPDDNKTEEIVKMKNTAGKVMTAIGILLILAVVGLGGFLFYRRWRRQNAIVNQDFYQGIHEMRSG